jgi:hypothetical protein
MVWRGILLLLATMVFTGCKPGSVSPATQNKPEDKPQDQSITATEGPKLLAPGNAPTAKASFPDVLTSSTAYYTTGPQQGRPADGTLAEGTPVRVIAGAGSYSVVETADGIHAYVSTGAIGKDKPQLGDK